MSNTLLGMIHDRALANAPNVEITALNYQIWVDHWFYTAYELAEEFDREGLPATADAVRTLIIEQGRLYK